jgi:hypothetical protein
MHIGAIENSNLTLKGNGHDVADLLCIVDREECTFTSAWIPTPAEVMALMEGAPVYLKLWTNGQHPPVFIGVKGVTL